jgi:DNA-3-methyladenine glycosylase I
VNDATRASRAIAPADATREDSLPRCSWAEGSAIEREYHDSEWGVPLHDDTALFELLTLEGAQAGLSWRTVLAKRARYRALFHDFDIARCARMTDAALLRVLGDAGIVRNRLKVHSVRTNAQAMQRVIAEHGSFDAWVWSFVDGKPQRNRPRRSSDVPTRTPLSDRLSAELRRVGFSFVGSTICYAFLQAAGLVDDHIQGCFRHDAMRGR